MAKDKNLALSGRGTQLTTAALRAGNTTPCTKIMLCVRRYFNKYVLIFLKVFVTFTASQIHEVDMRHVEVFKRY
jgi:hypothetical protein